MLLCKELLDSWIKVRASGMRRWPDRSLLNSGQWIDIDTGAHDIQTIELQEYNSVKE